MHVDEFLGRTSWRAGIRSLARDLRDWLVQGRSDMGEILWPPRAVAVCLVSAFVAIGGWATLRSGADTEADRRAKLRAQVAMFAGALEIEDLRALTFTNSDKGSAAYEGLRTKLTAFAKVAGVHGVYGVASRGGKILLGPTSHLDAEVGISPRLVTRQLEGENSAIFRDRRSLMTEWRGAKGDQYVAAWSPITDPETGQVIMAVGIDLAAARIAEAAEQARQGPLLVTLLLVVLVVAGQAALEWRERSSANGGHPLRYAEALFVGAAGLTITTAIGWRAYKVEATLRRDSFAAMARAQALGVVEVLRNLRMQLDTLGRLLEATPQVSARQFAAFAEPLSRGGLAQAWEWVPAVLPGDVADFERRRAEDSPEYALYQKDNAGGRSAVTTRDHYYPVCYAVPATGNEMALGYDLGSEPIRRAALEEAVRLRAPVASDPVTLVQERGSEQGMLVFRPVHARDPRTQGVRGFALMVLRLESTLRQSLRQSSNDDLGVVVSLSQLNEDRTSRLLASSAHEVASLKFSPNPVPETGIELETATPLFIFGKSYLITVTAKPAYLWEHPLRQNRIVGLLGLVLTTAVSAFVAVLLNRRANLERQVESRTLELSYSENLLRKERQRLVAIITGTNVGTWEWTVPTGELVVNDRWGEIIGYRLSELAPISIDTWVKHAHPDDLKVSQQLLERHFRGELEYYECECRMRHKDGRWIWVLDRGSVATWNPDGSPLLMSGTHQEITDRKQMEEEVRANLEAARRLSALKSQFVSVASHELRTPLAGAVNCTYLLDKAFDRLTPVKRGELLERLKSSHRRLLEIVEELLTLSRVEAGRIEVHFVQFDLREFVLGTIRELREGDTRQHEFLFEQVGPLSAGMTDPKLLRHILGNLLSNAVRYSPPQSQIAITLTVEPNSFTLDVADEGIGIPESDRDKIFEMFVRGSNVGNVSGSGLGLNIVKRFVELLNGDSALRPTTKGTAFRVRLPFPPSPSAVS